MRSWCASYIRCANGITVLDIVSRISASLMQLLEFLGGRNFLDVLVAPQMTILLMVAVREREYSLSRTATTKDGTVILQRFADEAVE